MDIDAAFAEHSVCLDAFRLAYSEQLAALTDAAIERVKKRQRIFFFGNGGSALDCSHIANELVLKYANWRSPVAAISLVENAGIISAAANDGYFDIYLARQIRALASSGDIAIGLSTSGTSANFILALEAAREMDLLTAAFVGASMSSSIADCDFVFSVSSGDPGRIQEIHMIALHIFCAGIEGALL
jgi:D-sedoheptulose 7-phosphate isomerase